MNFAESLGRLNDLLSAQERRAGVADARGEYQKLCDFLTQRIETAEGCAKQVEVLRAAGQSPSQFAPYLLPLAETVAVVLQDARDNPAVLEDQGERWQELLDDEAVLEGLLESAYDQVRESWQAPAVPAFYRLIARTGPLQEVYQRLRKCETNLGLMVPASMPSDPARVAAIFETAQERDRARAELEAAIPADVATMLRKASAGEATADDLTGEVLAWLRENGVAANVRLSLR
jgi:hypothetical protein